MRGLLRFATVASGLTLTVFAGSETPLQQAPARAAAVINPLGGDERTCRAGAKLYIRECAACHGTRGEGYQRALPLTAPEVRHASPGALFWVITHGSLRRGMPSFAHLPELQRWQIVEYLKSGDFRTGSNPDCQRIP